MRPSNVPVVGCRFAQSHRASHSPSACLTGSADHFGLDAIQFEFGADCRAKANIKATAAKVADAVAAFAKHYFLAKPVRSFSGANAPEESLTAIFHMQTAGLP